MVGLAVAFVGLAYHHHKRQLELIHQQRNPQATGILKA
jgi:hypothetical protein